MKQLLVFLLIHLFAETILARPKLTYYGSANNAPFEYLTNSGEAKGFYIDLLREIELLSGYDISVVLGNRDLLVREMNADDTDIIISTIFDGDDDHLRFTSPIAYLPYSIYCNSREYFNQLDVFDEKDVWVNADEVLLNYVQSIGTNRNIFVTGRLDTLFTGLTEGSVRALFAPTFQGDYLVRQYGLKDIRKYTPTDAVFKSCFALAKENEKMTAIINNALINLRQGGRYGDLFDKWFSTGQCLPQGRFSEFKNIAITILSVLLILSSLLWNFFLRRKVRLRTEELTKAMSFQKSILKKLYFSEKKYYGLFANMSNSAFMAQVLYNNEGVVDFEIKEVNKEFMALFNIMPEDIIGKRITDLYSEPIFNQRLFSVFRRIQANGKPQSMELFDQILKKWILVTGFQPDKDHVACVIEDITESIIATQLIKESEKKYRELMNNASVGITLIDLQGKVQFINKRGARNFDQSADRIIDKRLNQFLDPQNASYYMRQLAHIVKEGTVSDFEETLFINGKEKSYLSNYQPIRNNGKITGVQMGAFLK